MSATSTISPMLTGFGLGASLIVAIGSQNAFVLRQGLKRQYVFTVCTVCFLCDSLLIALGAGGFSSIVTASPRLMQVTLWGGVAFLFCYGVRAFMSALKPGALDTSGGDDVVDGLAKVALTTVMLSLINPHAFLDTVVLLGSLAGRYSGGARLLFAVGAMSASCAWFYGIGYGARVLAPLFRRPVAWRLLDILVGCTMWAIAGSLAFAR
ncbi:LysE/ArgO family amino acid transporter [Geomonas anaerohicana]|uniref:Amino acid transporter n=1 Tax=Geomonas anaerohicana TaxID=2798583 RepID=A0ABS0Y9D4_9BACT|nr:LysE/ArgO family amino acid transporter [Geomonas anaerohicana]MBJ6748901.1 amino acid transporter [Geomonas anaerohicana]